MKKALPIFLAVAASTFSAPYFPAAAYNAPAASVQAADGEAEANEAYKVYKAETNAAKKQEVAVEIISKYFASRAAEAITYDLLFSKTSSVADKNAIAVAYYQASNAAGKPGNYLEYALGQLATAETDPAKLIEFAKVYLSKFPEGRYKPYIGPAVSAARYKLFDAAYTAKKTNEAIQYANEAFAAGENEFLYAYRLSFLALTDLIAHGGNATLIGQAQGWADRGIRFVEEGKMPEGANADEWAKSKDKTLTTLYKTRGLAEFFSTAKRLPTAASDYDQSITALKKVTEFSPRDAEIYFFLAQAYNFQYAIHQKSYDALTEEEKAGDPGKAAIEKVDAAADMVIDAYLKVMAYADTNQALKDAVQPGLINLWQYRHESDPEGWKTEVQKLASAQ